jgi:hypothetical protein
LDTAHNLLLQYEKLCNMNQRLIPIEERLLIFQFMETIRNNIATSKFHRPPEPCVSYLK